MASLWILLILLLCPQDSRSEEKIFVKRFSSIYEDAVDYFSGTESCSMVPEESMGCLTHTVTEVQLNTSCLVLSFSHPNFTVYLKPGEAFQCLELDFIQKVIVTIGRAGTVTINPNAFHDLGGWHELTVQRNTQQKAYHVLIDGEEEFVTSMNYFEVLGTEVKLYMWGSASWSFTCDPRKHSSTPYILTPTGLGLLLTIVVVVIFTCVCLCVWMRRRRGRSSHHHQSRSVESSDVVTRPVSYHHSPQAPSGYPGGGTTLPVSNPDDYIYDELNDIFVEDPARPVDKTPIALAHSHERRHRLPHVSLTNSLYSRLGDEWAKNNGS